MPSGVGGVAELAGRESEVAALDAGRTKAEEGNGVIVEAEAR